MVKLTNYCYLEVADVLQLILASLHYTFLVLEDLRKEMVEQYTEIN